MLHLLAVCSLLVVAFNILKLLYPMERVYWLLASFPAIIFAVAITDDSVRGIQQINHRLFHIAYDSSYVLLLLGIILILRALLRRELMITVIAATSVAAIPLCYLLIMQSFVLNFR